MNSFQYIVTKNDVSTRIDKVLVDRNPSVSRSQIQSWIKQQYVSVNDTFVKANYKCQLGDLIKWSLPEPKKFELVPENIPLSIVYEDDDLLVINKPKGMVVHPTNDHQQ